MLLGALTIGGFFIGWLGRDDQMAFSTGKRFLLYGMIGAIIVGLIYLLTLGEVLRPLMRSPAILYIVVAFVLSLGALHLFFKQNFLPSSILMFVSMILMVSTRHHLRLLRLDQYYDPSTYAINPQWSVFVLFLVCFIIALCAVYYMLKLFFSGSVPAEQE
jgi:hypothetical protein